MAYETGKTLPYEILYILGAARNDTGLSPAQARLLTGAVLLALRTTIRPLYGPGELATKAAAGLMSALDLYLDATQIPPQSWEEETT